MSQVTSGEFVAQWVAKALERQFTSGQGIGQLVDGSLAAGIWFETIFGKSIIAHAAIPEPGFLSREFLWYIFFYPFQECGCEEILAPVSLDNLSAQRFVIRLGFSPKVTLEESPGKVTIVYSINQDACRWLQLKEHLNGQRHQ